MDIIDLNCDMGESFGAWTMGSDAEMLKIVTSANVACGFRRGHDFQHLGIAAHGPGAKALTHVAIQVDDVHRFPSARKRRC